MRRNSLDPYAVKRTTPPPKKKRPTTYRSPSTPSSPLNPRSPQPSTHQASTVALSPSATLSQQLAEIEKTVNKPRSSSIPLFIRDITTYLRQLITGSSTESYSVDENWKEFSVSSQQYSQLIEYLKQQEKSLWGFWQDRVK